MNALRFLPFHIASGAEQMARDEALLQSAAERGTATIRFYQWSEPTLSLGYFQPADSRLAEERLRSLAWVRRASGGAAILHHRPHELTYSFAIPSEIGWPANRGNAICEFHYLIRDVLNSHSASTRVVLCGEEKKLGESLCFLHHTPGDILLDGAKVVGSAQRKLRGAILQHGTILLSGSPYTPQLPGIQELAGVAVPPFEFALELTRRFAETLGVEVESGDWSQRECEDAEQIAREKYRSPEWNERR